MKANGAAINLFVAAACCWGCHQERAQPLLSPPVAQNTITTVELLIEQLVSPVPAKYPTGEWERLNGVEEINGYIHPQVERARDQLVAMGTQIYPTLAEHMHDDRYSYSGVYAAWENNAVGTMIADIMAEGIEPHLGGYKSRMNPTGSNGQPHFGAMVRDHGGFEKYASLAKGRPKSELRNEYVRWHIAKERSYGFTNSEQEQKYIGAYLKLLENK